MGAACHQIFALAGLWLEKPRLKFAMLKPQKCRRHTPWLGLFSGNPNQAECVIFTASLSLLRKICVLTAHTAKASTSGANTGARTSKARRQRQPAPAPPGLPKTPARKAPARQRDPRG